MGGISLTGTIEKEGVVQVIEPNASPLPERMAALELAHSRGLRTYGMLCPLLPGIANEPSQIEELVQFVTGCGAEEIFAEAVNPRGSGLRRTEEALRNAGCVTEADAVARIRKFRCWPPYVARLVQDVQQAARKFGTIEGLRFLLYSKDLLAGDLVQIQADDSGVIWL